MRDSDDVSADLPLIAAKCPAVLRASGLLSGMKVAAALLDERTTLARRGGVDETAGRGEHVHMGEPATAGAEVHGGERWSKLGRYGR